MPRPQGVASQSRQTPGRNWSNAVQPKQDHDLIDSGVYHCIRHPIHTGCCLHSSVRR